ncbi:phosphotriesterase family protein [Pleomorphovibrio marinus]|uniref:phosphotriesterase family protein n=1 Tax=Pleomorphovibrio marinus TaxID=2164132 RepID=UPI001E50FB27|nr:phosphotriesterase [Pleomorphovibrio marinus]
MEKKMFLLLVLFGVFVHAYSQEHPIMTVGGPIAPEKMGRTLVHEHLLVDFVGADQISEDRWDKREVMNVVLPQLEVIVKQGIGTLVDCTPAFLGRDVFLLEALMETSGLQILTNTGLYGAVDNKFLPTYAFEESAEQLAKRWITEWEEGIDGTDIRPGFIKIGVNPETLSTLHQKLVRAAAFTHLATGLSIASHTGPAVPAFEQMEILLEMGVSAEAFIWVHAQQEKDLNMLVEAAEMGAWISLDGLGEEQMQSYVGRLQYLKENGLLHKALISHDAGWFSPGEEDGGDFRPFTTLTEKFVPLMLTSGFTPTEIDMLLVKNPQEALKIRIRNKE